MPDAKKFRIRANKHFSAAFSQFKVVIDVFFLTFPFFYPSFTEDMKNNARQILVKAFDYLLFKSERA